MKNNYYSKSLQILIKELINFQRLLDDHCKPRLGESLNTLILEQIMNSVQKIKAMAEEAKSIQSLTLFNQDFSHFCLLLVEGSDMADYLLGLDETPTKIQKQARSWKKTAAKFRPFLKNSIYSQTEPFRLNLIK